jgi:hypothetical protein
MIVNATVHKHYREVFLRYKPAQDYAYRRWGQKYCDEIEIGFAPIDSKALARLPLQKEFLQELGLINKQGYDFFQNRIVIPIKDRYQHIIGFTARVMDDNQPKYLNSKESFLYSKRNTVFGLDVAWRAAGKTEQMYLVEGAPTVCVCMPSVCRTPWPTLVQHGQRSSFNSSRGQPVRCASFPTTTHQGRRRLWYGYRSRNEGREARH